MKSYILFLHWKQGDDLAAHVEKTKSLSAALLAWGEDFKHHSAACATIANALKGKKISVIADTHHISFTPKDAAAQNALEALTKEGFLSRDDDDAR